MQTLRVAFLEQFLDGIRKVPLETQLPVTNDAVLVQYKVGRPKVDVPGLRDGAVTPVQDRWPGDVVFLDHTFCDVWTVIAHPNKNDWFPRESLEKLFVLGRLRVMRAPKREDHNLSAIILQVDLVPIEIHPFEGRSRLADRKVLQLVKTLFRLVSQVAAILRLLA